MIVFGSVPFILAVLIFWAIASGRIGLGGCVIIGIWCGGAAVLAGLTLLAFAEQSAGKPFADKDTQFVLVGWLLLFGVPWLLRRRP